MRLEERASKKVGIKARVVENKLQGAKGGSMGVKAAKIREAKASRNNKVRGGKKAKKEKSKKVKKERVRKGGGRGE